MSGAKRCVPSMVLVLFSLINLVDDWLLHASDHLIDYNFVRSIIFNYIKIMVNFIPDSL